jgi:hypothetical protein
MLVTANPNEICLASKFFHDTKMPVKIRAGGMRLTLNVYETIV